MKKYLTGRLMALISGLVLATVVPYAANIGLLTPAQAECILNNSAQVKEADHPQITRDAIITDFDSHKPADGYGFDTVEMRAISVLQGLENVDR